MEDLSKLIQQCMRGNTRMQKVFYNQYYPLIMSICKRYAPTTEDAEQWTHDAIIKIFSQLNAYLFKGSFEGWIRKITVRVCLDNMRSKNSWNGMIELKDHADTNLGTSVHNDILSKISAAHLLYHLNQLPIKQKTVLNLFVFDECTVEEIAQTLNIKENYVYYLLHMGRKTLQNRLLDVNIKETSNEQ